MQSHHSRSRGRLLTIRIASLCALSAAVLQILAFLANDAKAQIIPDGTLPNNSRITTQDNIRIIEEGTRAGSNLFHSFQQFSVPAGSEAHFNNGLDIQNIISRVTGGSVSNIEGLIRANGTANLFVINPNGIVFGQGAQLNIGGSFLASTANSLKFADGFEFSATAPSSTPLLTISVPIGLQFGANPGRITVQGDGQGIRKTPDLIDTTVGLRVQPNQTLALVGGDVSLEGATLKTAGGRIELGSVAGTGLVSLTPTNKGFSLGYDAVQNFGILQLSQFSAVDASGTGGGDIQVWGRLVTLTNGSQIEASTLGAEQGGALVVHATELVEVNGSSANPQFFTSLTSNVYPDATGAAGNLTIHTRKLLVRDGGRVENSTFGAGKGGNLTVNADSVQVIATDTDSQYPSSLFAGAGNGSTGAAGNLTINTRELQVENGQVSVSTFGGGKEGNLTVNADSVQVIGNSSNSQFPTGLFASPNLNVTGAGGTLTIHTRELLVREGAQISVSTFGASNGGNLNVLADSVQVIGNAANKVPTGLFAVASNGATGAAGNLTIHTRELLVRDGAVLYTGTFGASKGGNLTVNADSVQVIGSSSNSQIPSTLFAGAGNGSTGAGGDLTIHTRELLVQDGALVSVRSIKGEGNAGNVAGNLRVRARSIRLDNKATLSADNQSINTDSNQEQATINLHSKDLILRHNSNITTNATGSQVIGGNINIDTGVLALFENSAIRANSANSFGGQVKIKTRGVFRTPGSITATGASRELNGTVQINTDVYPSLSLVALPTNLVDTSNQISQGCSPRGGKTASRFVATGRGGLPQSPDQPLFVRATITGWVTLEDESENSRGDAGTHRSEATGASRRKAKSSHPATAATKIVEANGWVVDKNGDIYLIAQSPVDTPHSPPLLPASCS